MTEREKLAAEYAWVLGKYGENSPQEREFLGAHQTDEDTALLCEVVLLCRGGR